MHLPWFGGAVEGLASTALGWTVGCAGTGLKVHAEEGHPDGSTASMPGSIAHLELLRYS
jgi:hypothetical protein